MPSLSFNSTITHEEFSSVIMQTSLFEGDFSIDWIIQLAGEKASVILEILEKACSEGILGKKHYGRYCFSKPEIQAAWQKKINPKQADILHRNITSILMSDFPDGEEKAKRIAAHLLNLKNDLERCHWLDKAGDIFLKSINGEDANKCYAKVLEDLSALEGPDVDDLYIKTALKYSKISEINFNIKRAMKVLKNALKRSEARENKRSSALLYMHIAKYKWYQSKYDSALTYFNKGWTISQELKDPGLMKSAVTFSTFFHYWQGRFQEAVDIYETHVSEMDKTLQGSFPLIAYSTIGYCYTLIGQVAQGLGMINTARHICIKTNNLFLKAYSEAVMASSLLNLNRIDEAIEYIQSSYREIKKWPDNPLLLFFTILLAFANYLKEDKKKANTYLKKFLKLRDRLNISIMWPIPYEMELYWAMEINALPSIHGYSIQSEIQHALKTRSVFLTGLAYRYQARLEQRRQSSAEHIQKLLQQSETWLEKSGDHVELARTRFALANHYFSIDQIKQGKEMVKNTSNILAHIPTASIPEDLKSQYKNNSTQENLYNNLIEAGNKTMDTGNSDVLIHQMVTSANRILGAERGAVFTMEKQDPQQEIKLLSGNNLTSEQISHPAFSFAIHAIKKVFQTQKGIIKSQEPDPNLPSDESIRSLICTPVVHGKLLGVLYYDNRLLLNTFIDEDLKFLNFYAAMVGLAIENQNMKSELQSILSGLLEKDRSDTPESGLWEIVGQSEGMKKVFSHIHQVAPTNSTVLILGETGVGKDLVAKAIHQESKRKKGPFVAVNCNALPDHLISSELFGHEKGAFTGAHKQHIGRFELADEGTLFIDEIGELPIETQVRLLRVIQTREFERVGGNRSIKSDFRLIVATNRKIEEEVQLGNFRSDLFFRLNTFPILIPPLRERNEDIPLLAHHFLQIYALKVGKKFKIFPENEMDKLVRYNWPGNVREMEHIIERGTILAQDKIFRVPELAPSMGNAAQSHVTAGMSLREMEKNHILQTLKKTKGKIRGTDGAAEILDIHPSTLYSRMKKFDIRK